MRFDVRPNPRPWTPLKRGNLRDLDPPQHGCETVERHPPHAWDQTKDVTNPMSSLPDHDAGLVLNDLADPPPAWADLSLPELREYRRRLTDEEEKISYWRRLVHEIGRAHV